MTRVLFVASAVSYFREMAPVVWHFADRGWDVRVLLGSSGPLTEDTIRQCRERGIEPDVAPSGIGYGGEAAAGSNVVAPAEGMAAPVAERQTAPMMWLRQLARWTRFGRFLRIPSDFARMRGIRRFGEDYLRRVRPDVVFQGAYHSVGQIDNGIARACKANRIPRYCLPNSGYVGGRIMPVGRRSHLDTGMASSGILVGYDWVNRLFAWLFPRWTWTLRDGRRIFYWDPVFMFVAWMSDLFFERMWMKPATDFRRVFVFSDYSAGLLRDDGYPDDKIMVAGQPLLDSVWERSASAEQQRSLYQYLGLETGSPFLLVNIEPSAEHSYCSWEMHWENFRSVMEAVSGRGLPVILSLHPLCDAPRYEFAVEKYRCFICRDYKIHDLYPFCRLSISFPCSTNLLAAVFQKPLVIFDFHGLTTADADSAFVHALPGATLAHTGTQLSQAIDRLLEGRDGAAPFSRPVRLATETVFDTVATDLGLGHERTRQDAALGGTAPAEVSLGTG